MSAGRRLLFLCCAYYAIPASAASPVGFVLAALIGLAYYVTLLFEECVGYVQPYTLPLPFALR